MAERVVECALTERAKKKLERQTRRPKKEGPDDVSETQEARRESLPPPRERGVIYLGHIPHGFYEQEIRSYFTQFGTVTRLKLYRSKKTGRSRGYAFVEFEFPEVAAVAAESMNNYLMYDKLLKCHVVEPGRVSRRMLTAGRDVPSREKTLHRARVEHNRPRTVPEAQKRVSRLLSRENRKRTRLDQLGVDYDFSGYRGICSALAPTKRPTHVVFTEEDDEDMKKEEEEEEGESGCEGVQETESE